MKSSIDRPPTFCTISGLFLLCLLPPGACAETIGICESPTNLPIPTDLGTYSPPICFAYDGLQSGAVYTLKVWLLAPTSGPWPHASDQWRERTFSLDNTSGMNATGVIRVVEAMNVFNYPTFDWVLRLYNSNNAE